VIFDNFIILRHIFQCPTKVSSLKNLMYLGLCFVTLAYRHPWAKNIFLSQYLSIAIFYKKNIVGRIKCTKTLFCPTVLPAKNDRLTAAVDVDVRPKTLIICKDFVKYFATTVVWEKSIDTLKKYFNAKSYRVGRRFRLTNQDDYFESVLTFLKLSINFRGSWGSSVNCWIKP